MSISETALSHFYFFWELLVMDSQAHFLMLFSEFFYTLDISPVRTGKDSLPFWGLHLSLFVFLSFVLKSSGKVLLKENFPGLLFTSLSQHAAKTMRIPWANDTAYAVVWSTRCAQLCIIATVVMDTSFSKSGIGFYFRFPQSWAVAGEDNQFALPSLLIFSLYPSTYFPLLITSWSLELICSRDFSVFSEATMFPPDYPHQDQPPRWPMSEKGRSPNSWASRVPFRKSFLTPYPIAPVRCSSSSSSVSGIAAGFVPLWSWFSCKVIGMALISLDCTWTSVLP